MTPRSILCPVDFSDQSRLALRWAALFARRPGGRVTVLTVVEPLLAEAARVRLGMDLANDETGPELREFVAASLPEGAAEHVRLDVAVGRPAETIVATAERERADMVVMGTQGLGGLRKAILGSTAERVLRSGRTTVLAVPPSGTPAAGAPAIGRILAATDFSATAAAAVQAASALAREFSVPLTLLHVVEPVVAPPRWTSYAAESEAPRAADARARLERVAADTDGAGGPVVAVGRAAETIAATAEELGAGLIVMGLTGGDGLFAPRPGSIAYRVLGLAKVPVLVVASAHESP